MFSGLVEALGTVAEIHPVSPGVRLKIRAPLIADDAHLGDSISVNGCCLDGRRHGW